MVVVKMQYQNGNVYQELSKKKRGKKYMNVIISNKYQSLLANLDIDVIKSINGEFDVEEIVSNFTNFFFNISTTI